KYGFETEILDRARCEELGMGLFLAVARGSGLEPAFIIMRYKGAPVTEGTIGFVGKGITYDSGGYHIKTSGMESMYMDMNGGAGVIGAMCAIAGRRLAVNVTAVVAACENMVDSTAYRNGDILRSMNGKTVYVQNTDAEGRLTMADAITYLVRKEKPSEIIEMAGLTGSVCNFYGDTCAAALPTRHYMYDRIASLTDITGELYACMPEFPEYNELLKSPYADVTNAPANAPGIGAAAFLCSFSEDIPFISIDTGRMPFNSRVYDGHPAGATGFGVQTLYWYAKKSAAGEFGSTGNA
ncbi:MAG: leucyl aminopeptidase family protein, partial [Lachnospiraceae bacterium]|nr:leucyl aminopeptidase family protein [Lachnospiraceae bacterium]